MFRDNTFPSTGTSLPIEHGIDSPPPSPRMNNNNNLDDVFGSATPSPTSQNFRDGIACHNTELSDIDRMRSKHSTSGYRDGLSSAKSTTIQEGFDEGYSLGAAFGLEVGFLLGLLEGIHAAVLVLDNNTAEDGTKIKGLLDEARKDLKLEQIFNRKWWGEDGIWTYPVAEDKEEGREAFTFKDVVLCHPVIMRWKRLIVTEVERWGLDMNVMEGMDVKRIDVEDVVVKEAASS